MSDQPSIQTWKDPRIRHAARDAWRRFKKDNHPCDMGPEVENIMLYCIAIETFRTGKTMYDSQIYEIMLNAFEQAKDDLEQKLEEQIEKEGPIKW